MDTRAIKFYFRAFNNEFIAYTFLSNIPQVVISLVYFSYNSIFTSMLLNYEWVISRVRKEESCMMGLPASMLIPSVFCLMDFTDCILGGPLTRTIKRDCESLLKPKELKGRHISCHYHIGLRCPSWQSVALHTG